jgi:hypothetical protein
MIDILAGDKRSSLFHHFDSDEEKNYFTLTLTFFCLKQILFKTFSKFRAALQFYANAVSHGRTKFYLYFVSKELQHRQFTFIRRSADNSIQTKFAKHLQK